MRCLAGDTWNCVLFWCRLHAIGTNPRTEAEPKQIIAQRLSHAYSTPHCVKDGGVALTKAITRGYTSWVKGLMSEPFALALQCAEDVRELSRRSVMGKDWVMVMQGHWFFHSRLPSCTSTWIPGSILGWQGQMDLMLSVCDTVSVHVLCLCGRGLTMCFGCCNAGGLLGLLHILCVWQRAYYVLWLLQCGWVARPTAHSSWDWNPICGEENAQSLSYVCPLVVLSLQLWWAAMALAPSTLR